MDCKNNFVLMTSKLPPLGLFTYLCKHTSIPSSPHTSSPHAHTLFKPRIFILSFYKERMTHDSDFVFKGAVSRSKALKGIVSQPSNFTFS
jgi:hypothetical protein